MKKNTPEVWDEVWNDPGINSDFPLIVATERASLRWQKVSRSVLSHFGSMANLRVIEVGAGAGTYAALLAKEGAQATLLDYSQKALDRASQLFHSNTIQVRLLNIDALHPPKNILKNEYDLSISVGLTEHFSGEDRIRIHQFHLDIIRPGGLAIFLVPNALNPPYRIYKWLYEKLGMWKFGEEYPFTRQELLHICTKIGGETLSLEADNFYSSLRFLVPAHRLRRLLRLGSPRNLEDIWQEGSTPLDNILGYCWIFVVRKPED